MLRNIRLDIEYDGTHYSGWQRQENGPSIQAEIEDVLGKVLQEPCTIIGAGRTDAGVHARGQAANFRTENSISLDRLCGALNGLLPEDIVVLCVREVPFEFHARYSALARRYSYHITKVPTALERHTSWHLRYDLDVSLMRAAAAAVLGEHDFEAFCRVGADVEHHRCIVSASDWSAENNALRYTICANRFLHGMVRALVGTMVDIGRGYRKLEEMNDILASHDRTQAGQAAPARGLVLEEVVY